MHRREFLVSMAPVLGVAATSMAVPVSALSLVSEPVMANDAAMSAWRSWYDSVVMKDLFSGEEFFSRPLRDADFVEFQNEMTRFAESSAP